MREYLFLVVALSLNAAANILLKLATSKADSAEEGFAATAGLYLSPWFIAGVICFGLNLLSYTQALQKIPLVVAYPIMVGTGYLIMVIVSRPLLGESFTWIQLVGAVLILAGLILIIPRS